MTTRFFSGIAAATIIGAAAGMLLYPQMDRNTRSKLKKSGRIMKNVAGDALDEMMHWKR